MCIYHSRYVRVCVCSRGWVRRMRKQFRSALFGSASVNIFLFLNPLHSLFPTLQRLAMSVHSLIPIRHALSFPFSPVAVPFSIIPPLTMPSPSYTKSPLPSLTVGILTYGPSLDWGVFWRIIDGKHWESRGAWIDSLLIQ